jgi:hypothetical protein
VRERLREARVDEHSDPLECVAALVIREGALLAEERKLTKKVVPGAFAQTAAKRVA